MSTTVTGAVIGATGQIGRLVVEEALADGVTVLALTRDAARAQRRLPEGAQVIEVDPTDAAALTPVLADVDVVVLTHGGDMDGQGGRSFYDVVAAVIEATKDRPGTHLSLMTAMNTSHRPTHYEFVEWKRRAERLLRASGRPYVIVRPGWFDYQGPADHRIDLHQGDLVTGQPGVDRRHVADVLLAGAHAATAPGRTVEVFSAAGDPVEDVVALL
ncbi:NAD(P)H-binding protein, partial [Actinomyces radicidentis]|uniref:NAD(P)H-binding protein n=1 Tax=Actinomyces radicidentis TaxID=111015 RepID=UPI0026E0733B